jgi:hypothetical protein
LVLKAGEKEPVQQAGVQLMDLELSQWQELQREPKCAQKQAI